MHLPQTISTYFEADRRNDCAAVLACFSPDATLRDEGRSHSGHDAIAHWWEHSKASYRHVAEPLEATTRENVTRVRARVTGAFPGSPALLAYAFTLAGEEISALEIGA